ncbi:hypothetical protein FLL45_09155 [Aliikangiella marina]|uniref:DUF2062 domain-containing protein n=1 Tax=Aliikangiella marina TaxID=1712262 RepID=A0A545TD03_9GAMM|nr:hypothetical protein [Aliikangiella marina]TQV75098.1 hypothetical protein FLL45_09155 [Aliikangiella marina]
MAQVIFGIAIILTLAKTSFSLPGSISEFLFFHNAQSLLFTEKGVAISVATIVFIVLMTIVMSFLLVFYWRALLRSRFSHKI